MEILISLLLLGGTFLVIVATVGVHRLRDPYSRLHAMSTSSTLGLLSILFASVFYFEGVVGHNARQLLTIAFIFLTVPAGTHMLCRAALGRGVKLWKPQGQMTAEEHQIIDELHRIVSPAPTETPFDSERAERAEG